MKLTKNPFALGLGLTLAWTIFTTAVPAAEAPLLRYQLPLNTTNFYNVELETHGENGTDILKGRLLIMTAPSTNSIRLQVRGTLAPNRSQSAPVFYINRYPPRWNQAVILSEGAELEMNEQGLILRTANDKALTFPLGSILPALVETLPASASAQWETVEQLAVLDQPMNLGPFLGGTQTRPNSFNYYPYDVQNVLPASRTNSYSIQSETAGLITVGKKIRIASRLQTEKNPRFQAEGEGSFVFDANLGRLQKSEFQFQAAFNTATVTRRLKATWRCQLLTGEDLEQALQPPPPPPPPVITPKISETELQQITIGLRSKEYDTRLAAIQQLRKGELTAVTPQFMAAMAVIAREGDDQMQSTAAGVLAKFGIKTDVPALISLMHIPDPAVRKTIVGGLGRLKDKRAIRVLAEFIATGEDGTAEAAEALSGFGAEIENTALGLLGEKHVGTRRQACIILKKIGTKKSLPALKAASFHSDRPLSQAATDAVRAIQFRTGEGYGRRID